MDRRMAVDRREDNESKIQEENKEGKTKRPEFIFYTGRIFWKRFYRKHLKPL